MTCKKLLKIKVIDCPVTEGEWKRPEEEKRIAGALRSMRTPLDKLYKKISDIALQANRVEMDDRTEQLEKAGAIKIPASPMGTISLTSRCPLGNNPMREVFSVK
jgi:hypothetical protein